MRLIPNRKETRPMPTATIEQETTLSQSTPRRSPPPSTAVLRQLQLVATTALARNPQQPLAKMRIADLHRALGDLDRAAALYQEIASDTGDVLASYLAALMRGEATLYVEAEMPLPVPFVRRKNALPDAAVSALWDHLESNRGEFHASRVFDKAGQQSTNLEKRHSLRLDADARLSEIVLPHVVALLADDSNWTRLRMRRFHPTNVSMEAAVHLDGGKFTAHRDCGKPVPDRRLSFIFYLHREPRKFTGGDLLLYDETGAFPGFSRIDPQHNSAILFPCSALHEVTPVQATPGDLLDGRITVHGWLHCGDSHVE
jgi:predicted 2-oxoglutarate/Fe(II)-dependent dioxygenase YbiX